MVVFMRWWAILYLMFFIVWSSVSIKNDYFRNKQSLWSIVLSALSNFVIFYLFLAYYWQPLVITDFRYIFLLAFILSAGWQVVQELRGLRKIYHHPDLTNTEFYIIVMIPVIFLFPVYLIAGLSAFK